MTTLGLPAAPRRAPRPRRPGRLILLGLLALLLLAAAAAAAPWLAPWDPEEMDVIGVMGPPSAAHPFGSDVMGRDVLSRVLFALRASLLVSTSAVLLSLLVAIPLGLVAGYFGRWVDGAISRALDMILVLPAMLLAITFIAILGPGSTVAALAIAVIYLPILARVMRTGALVVTRNDYVLGARARGASHLRVLLTHVLPNALGPVIVQASILAAFALQLEAGLSFLGLGVQPPTPSLGSMLADGRDVLTQAPWVEIFPGLAIVAAVLAFTVLGEGLRQAFDPEGVAE
ncbi:Dipeptide transport system permease protein DppC [Rubellimicrobium mesophilum DSM 19309]|uniref:Dipeptide transport system permease protein DppC n=1 Tax=Rubellimicrobium mesophilum DSM 19309 TaxID=442562 RepID=A0A017HPX2_9RHOB|nr:ABC transporter permease [Rubellimicrobium mesophilum]EYD76208.1 Dipeptide transport system permease protein DppC [Rubellimicrobium mesophilum DSM 19309]